MREPSPERARFLWGLCYRITGVAADADEIVQETWLRALSHPPRDDVPLEPWLTRVAANLACDRLRRRRRERYIGPWLPTLVEFEDDPPSTLYERLESVSTAFLVVLEQLTPTQRTVLILRDVFEQPASQVGKALGLSEANVRTVHRRARQRLAAWHRERPSFDEDLVSRVESAIERLVAALMNQDVKALMALLRDDVVEIVDGGGHYYSAKVPLRGATRVARFNQRLLQIRGFPISLEVRRFNGLPALVVDFACRRERDAPRAVLAPLVDAEGRIWRLFSFVAPLKTGASRMLGIGVGPASMRGG